MDFKISNEKLHSLCQTIIDNTFDSIKKESDDWGLGEAYELEVLGSIDKIVVNRVVSYTRINIYVDLYVISTSYEYDDVMSELNYRIQENYLPNSFVQINEIIEED